MGVKQNYARFRVQQEEGSEGELVFFNNLEALEDSWMKSSVLEAASACIRKTAIFRFP